MTLIMIIHVVFGTIAVVFGAIPLMVKKGGKIHKKTGTVYFYAMIIMATAGGVAAIQNSQTINIFAAILTLYLVITAQAAIAFKPFTINKRFYASFLLIGIVAISAISCAYFAYSQPEGVYQDFHYSAYGFIGAIAAISLFLDCKVMAQKQLSRTSQLRRHIWRMTFSYFIATGSLFTGPGASAFPEFIAETGVLSLPEPVILLCLVYWLVKTRRSVRRINE